jgi:hypothetical protein
VEHVERVRDVQVQTLFRSQPVQRLPAARLHKKEGILKTELRIRIRRNPMFLGLLDPDPLVRGTDPAPAPDPSTIKQK